MSVVVRMEMPKGCLDCPCVNGEYGCCQADKEERQIGDPNERPSWCPIICQLPERHGRLIDADAMAEDLDFDVENDQRALDDMDIVGNERTMLQFDKDCKQNCVWYLSEASTIVPAAERSKI